MRTVNQATRCIKAYTVTTINYVQCNKSRVVMLLSCGEYVVLCVVPLLFFIIDGLDWLAPKV